MKLQAFGSEAPPQLFPLSVHSSGRYLVDAQGRPFALRTEFAWIMATWFTREQVLQYLDDRSHRGFNGFELMAIMVDSGSPYQFRRANAYGQEPFTTVGDLSTPNPAYFDHLEYIIDQAAKRGMVAEVYHSYLGYNGEAAQGWYTTLAANSLAACQSYGNYLGTRFGGKTNVFWMNGGDYSPPNDATLAKHRAILTSIRAAGGYQLSGSEWGGPDSLVTEVDSTSGAGGFTFGLDPKTSDMQLDTFYGLGPGQLGLTYVTAQRSWDRTSPILPSIGSEMLQYLGPYSGSSGDRASLRNYQHWAITSGAIAGCNAGDYEINFGATPYFAAWQNPWVDDFTVLIAFYKSLKWWMMRPSGTASGRAGLNLVSSGAGSGTTQITSCMASDGSQIVAFVPNTGTSATTFGLNLTGLQSPRDFIFVDPTTGATQAVGTFSNTLSNQSFTTPGANASGANDWLLVGK